MHYTMDVLTNQFSLNKDTVNGNALDNLTSYIYPEITLNTYLKQKYLYANRKKESGSLMNICSTNQTTAENA